MVTKRNKRQHEAVFKAIADPTRRQILGILREGQRSVGEIAENFKMSRPAISKHLRLLRSAGLIATRKRGTTSLCSLSAEPLSAVGEWVQGYEMFWKQSLEGLKKYVEDEG